VRASTLVSAVVLASVRASTPVRALALASAVVLVSVVEQASAPEPQP
jgi:hypothetical protein